MRILVTDGDNRSALAVTRSLGAAGHTVLVGERFAPSLAQASRHCAQAVVYPDPVRTSDAFVEFLGAFVRREQIDVVIPVGDITTFLVAGHRSQLGPDCVVPCAPIDVIERAANKVDIMRTAEHIGVPIPRTVVVEAPDQVPELDLGSPIVIKPHQSRIATADGWKASSVSYAGSREALLRDLAARPRHEFPVLLQSCVRGPGIGIFACYHQGRPIALFSHRRLRERPPWGGVSVLSESVPLDPVACGYATRLLETIGWSGVAMVEFKRDLADGLPKLMEINGRFWGSLQLAVDAGVDFPRLLVETLGPAPVEAPRAYRVGARSRWWWGDVDALLFHLLRRDQWPGVPTMSRTQAVLDFMRTVEPDVRFENPRREDLGPWWYETKQRLMPRLRRSTTNGVRGSGGSAAGQLPRQHATPSGGPLLHTRVSSALECQLDAPRWNAVVARSDTNSVFQTYEWTHAFATTAGRQGTPLIVQVLEGDQLRGIASLAIEERRGRRVIRFLADRRADYCDILAGPDPEPVLRQLFATLQADPSWDAIDLVNIPSVSRTTTVLHQAAKQAGYHVLLREHSACPTLLIHGYEAHARELLDKKSLRRRLNYFRRSGRFVCRHLTSFRDIEPYLGAFFAQHIDRWRNTPSPSLFLHPHNQEFYRALAVETAEAGSLVFTVCEVEDRPIAFHFGFDYNGSVIWYKPTFDQEFAKHSPGLVLVHELLQYALAHHRRELDFTLGAEPFKARFANHARQTLRIQVFRRTTDYLIARARRRAMAAARAVTPR